MLEIILIRHGQTDWNRERRIMGRRPIGLNALGRRQSIAAARHFRGVPIDAIYTSPVRRAVETARLIARVLRPHRVPIHRAAELAEIEYGKWVGKTFDEVTGQGPYQVYHTTPKRAKPPGGEKMTTAQRRAVRLVERLRKHAKGGRVALVSHADIIKSILVHYLKLDLDELLRFRIDNGAISLLWFNGTRARVLAINCPPLPDGLFGKTDQLPVPHKK